MTRQQEAQPRAQDKTPVPAASNGWHVFDDFRDDMQRLLHRTFGDALPLPRRSGWLTSAGGFDAQMDVAESVDAIDITVDVPGMRQDDIEVVLNGDVLTIKGARTTSSEDKQKDYHVIERASGSFHRRLTLGCEVDRDMVSATVKDGVLHLHLPKSVKARAAERRIPIKPA